MPGIGLKTNRKSLTNYCLWMENTEDLKKQLSKALNECARLKAENDRLRRMLGQDPESGACNPQWYRCRTQPAFYSNSF